MKIKPRRNRDRQKRNNLWSAVFAGGWILQWGVISKGQEIGVAYVKTMARRKEGFMMFEVEEIKIAVKLKKIRRKNGES